jgi:hypothetical protein
VNRGVIETGPSSAPADRAMTADRDETKFVVAPERVRALLHALTRELSPHRFSGEGANLLPDAEHYSTTVYFDTPSHALYRAARDNPEQNSKLRAREYYDLHSSLAELATSPEQIVRHQPWLFFELKRREGARTFKHRVRLHKTDVADCFRNNAFEQARQLEDSQAERDDRAALAAFCAGLSEPLTPSCVVNYRRLAFQDASAALRVTIDLDVAYYLPPDALWTGPHALLRGRCGQPVGALRGCLAEVKARGEAPAWLTRALAAAQAKLDVYSKFNAASEAVALAADEARAREAAHP